MSIEKKIGKMNQQSNGIRPQLGRKGVISIILMRKAEP